MSVVNEETPLILSDIKSYNGDNEFCNVQTIKLRIQNICCGKEAVVIKEKLINLNGIKSVNVNIVSRLAYVTHDASVIQSSVILKILNDLQLGASLLESGTLDHQENKFFKTFLFQWFNLIIMTSLFIAVVVTSFKKPLYTKWISIPLLTIGGLPMLHMLFLNLKRKVFANINLLMLIAIIGAVVLYEWLDACIIVYVFIIAELIERICKYKVEKSIAALMVKRPNVAVLAENNKTVPIEQVQIGSLIIVCAGEQIPLDGEVVSGKAAVDESTITGESVPVKKVVSSKVFSGTILQTGFLKIKTVCDYNSSTLFQISQLTELALAKESHTVKLMNKFAQYYIPIILFGSFLCFMIPYIIHKVKPSIISNTGIHLWGVRALTILVAGCPCSLVMATPLAIVSGITTAAKNGLLIKGGEYLELLARTKTIAFDKTATLTEGRFQVINEAFFNSMNGDDVIKVAAALELKSSHPLAAPIVSRYLGCLTDMLLKEGSQFGLPEVSDFEVESGMGLQGKIEGVNVAIGNIELMKKLNILIHQKSQEYLKDWSNQGFTVVFIAIDGTLKGIYGLADKLRVSAPLVVEQLQKMGIEVTMLTGDNEGSAMMVMRNIGLKSCRFSMTPTNKFEWIEQKKNECHKVGFTVAMIGDGINDSPALAAADVGIAIGSSAAALTFQSAGILQMSDNLLKIVDLLQLAKYCRIIVFQNIIGAVLIKLVFVLIALSGHSMLWFAVLSDAFGLLYVMLNGMRPLYWKPKVGNADVTQKDA
ncbi:probable cadmium-transporting ATPase [Hydra vulgaris]|uniref:probable cadmium-transporting ATPase n=1 Tax=Hydra vulgaris TaxID=6087 RepID=UPI001F5F0099|nr:probable cadmium-transporting ATPase isoform X1 [Hydra vulgaris]